MEKIANSYYICVYFQEHIEISVIKIDTADYAYCVTQKTVFEKINLDTEEVVFAIKIINMDTEMSAEKIIVSLGFEIDSIRIYMVITLINQDIIMLL